MGKIGSKSGKIIKIGWNRLKSRFHHRFNDFTRRKKKAMYLPGVDRLLALTKQMQCFSSVFFAFQFIIHVQNKKKSLNWNPKIPAVPKLRIPRWLSLYLFLSAIHDSSIPQSPSTGTPQQPSPLIDDVLFTSHRENQSPPNNNGISPVSTR
jgi:hypothetical protein